MEETRVESCMVSSAPKSEWDGPPPVWCHLTPAIAEPTPALIVSHSEVSPTRSSPTDPPEVPCGTCITSGRYAVAREIQIRKKVEEMIRVWLKKRE